MPGPAARAAAVRAPLKRNRLREVSANSVLMRQEARDGGTYRHMSNVLSVYDDRAVPGVRRRSASSAAGRPPSAPPPASRDGSSRRAGASAPGDGSAGRTAAQSSPSKTPGGGTQRSGRQR